MANKILLMFLIFVFGTIQMKNLIWVVLLLEALVYSYLS